MDTTNEHDFLGNVTDEDLRQSAMNILSSYSHVTDVLAESLQNAVDAVDERVQFSDEEVSARIHIYFDVPRKRVMVTDTGTGMNEDVLMSAPSPNVTYKRHRPDGKARRPRGEKGVGLSFLTFISNKLTVRTSDGITSIQAMVERANDWVHERVETRPMLMYSTLDPAELAADLGSPCFTQVDIEDINTAEYSEDDLFNFTPHQLVYWLRTRTAIGNTQELTTGIVPVPDIEVTLTFKDKDGQQTEWQVPYRYLSPQEKLSDTSLLTYEQLGKLLMSQKQRTAQGKALIYRATKETASGRLIGCYAFAMAPRAFNDLAQDDEERENWTPPKWTGIYIATRGMPTGIEIDPPSTGLAGYWSRVLLVLQDDEMKFDVGRKSLVGAAKPMMQRVAREVWDDILVYLQQLTPAPTEGVRRQKRDKNDQIFVQARGWPELGLDISFLKEPQREQMVVALFYELVGAGYLKGYKTMRNNNFDQYDAFIRYEIPTNLIGSSEAAALRTKTIRQDIMVEFKHSAFDILKDLEEDTKRFQDIDLLICWDLQSQKLEQKDITVEELAPESVYFFGSTHKLFFPGIFYGLEHLAVIELKTFRDQVLLSASGANE